MWPFSSRYRSSKNSMATLTRTAVFHCSVLHGLQFQNSWIVTLNGDVAWLRAIAGTSTVILHLGRSYYWQPSTLLLLGYGLLNSKQKGSPITFNLILSYWLLQVKTTILSWCEQLLWVQNENTSAVQHFELYVYTYIYIYIWYMIIRVQNVFWSFPRCITD